MQKDNKQFKLIFLQKSFTENKRRAQKFHVFSLSIMLLIQKNQLSEKQTKS